MGNSWTATSREKDYSTNAPREHGVGNSWSEPFRLKDFGTEAPPQHGVYEIGFFRNGTFSQKYLGRASGKRKTIRNRLSSHYKGTGNANVKKYVNKATRDNLYARFKTMSGEEACRAEAEGLTNRPEDYPWNKHGEKGKSCHRFAVPPQPVADSNCSIM